jgi:DNA polymerase-3 subunit epsilon
VNPGIPNFGRGHGRCTELCPKTWQTSPTFRQLAQKIWDFIGTGPIWPGYNSNRFDVPMLMEEFARVGMEFDVSEAAFDRCAAYFL